MAMLAGAKALSSLSTIATVAGTAISAISAVQMGQAQAATATYQQQVALRNQQIAEENAKRAMDNTQIQQQDWAEEARQQLGQMLGEISASGVTLEGGTAGLLRRGVRRLAQRDATRIQEEGTTTARNLRQQAADFGGQAAFAGMEARNARSAGSLGMFSSFISGASQLVRDRTSLLRSREA